MKDQGKQAKTCHKIVGYDANALIYLWATMQDMPTGSFTRRREETGSREKVLPGWQPSGSSGRHMKEEFLYATK